MRDELELVCPTCRARQVVSDECRRCRSDLRLVRQSLQEGGELTRKVLRALARGDTVGSVIAAQARFDWRRDDESERLLSVCHAIQKNSCFSSDPDL